MPAASALRRGLLEQAGVEVEAREAGRSEQPGERRHRHAPATAHLEHAPAGGQAQGPDHQRDLDRRLAGVAAGFVGEGTVLGLGAPGPGRAGTGECRRVGIGELHGPLRG